jgi:hypothetical protein
MTWLTADFESGIVLLNMKPLVNHGELITRPAFDEGRERRYGLHLAMFMRNRFYAIPRIHSRTLAGGC